MSAFVTGLASALCARSVLGATRHARVRRERAGSIEENESAPAADAVADRAVEWGGAAKRVRLPKSPLSAGSGPLR